MLALTTQKKPKNHRLRFLITSVLIVLTFSIAGQQNKRDSLYNLFLSAEPEEKSNLYEHLAFTYYPSNIDSGTIYLKLAAKEAQENDQHEQLGRVLRNVATFHYMLQDYDSAKLYYSKTIVTLNKYHLETGLAEAYRGLGICFFEQGQYTSSVTQYQEALKIFERRNDSIGIARTLNSIGTSLETMGDVRNAHPYYEQSLLIKEQLKDSSGVAVGFINIGNVLSQMDKYNQAVENYQTAIEIALNLKDDRLYVDAYNCMAQSSFDHKKLDLAKEYWTTALKTFDVYQNDYQKTQIYNGLGSLYLELKQYEEAIQVAHNAIDISKNIDSKQELKKAYYNYAEASAGLKDYEQAYSTILQYAHLKDSLVGREDMSAVQEIRAKYEKEKDGREIAELKLMNQIQKNATKQQSSLKNGLIIGIIIIAVLLFIVIFLMIQRGKDAKSLKDSLQEKEILLQEVHHRVKNNFQLISSLLNLHGNVVSDPNAIEALEKSKSRILSMALVHQNIYATENIGKIDLQKYVEDLSVQVVSSMKQEKLQLDTEISTNQTKLNIEEAIPLGLILNELITNSCKYAFEGRSSGVISIVVQPLNEGKFKVKYKDNGIGLGSRSDIEEFNTLGLELVRLLVAQLHGEMSVNQDNGLEYIITFKPKFNNSND